MKIPTTGTHSLILSLLWSFGSEVALPNRRGSSRLIQQPGVANL